MQDYQLILGDCLEKMKDISDASIDCTITDLPYGLTACKWDSVIPFEPMWKELKRICKPKAAICLFGSQPFTSMLIASGIDLFKYCWVWQKAKGAGFLNAKNAPIKYHEDLAVFSKGTTANCSPNQMKYFPQNLRPVHRVRKNYNQGTVDFRPCRVNDYTQKFEGYPTTILSYPNDGNGFHPTQKPVELLRYLIRTYTLENETVLDFTAGSFSTGVAAVLEKRRFIGIEQDENYFQIGVKRMNEALRQMAENPTLVSYDKADKDRQDSQDGSLLLPFQIHERGEYDAQV